MIHNGMPMKRLLSSVAERTTSNFSFFLPAQMRRLEALTGIDARKLLWEHTVFPYVVAFMPEREVKRLESKVLSGLAAGCMSSLVKSVTHATGHLRLCRACTTDDEDRFGESYWHRSHCLPAVHVCRIHDQLLLRSDVPANAASRSYGDGLPQHQTGAAEDLGADIGVLQSLSHSSYVASMRCDGHKPDWELRYRRLAMTKGFQTTTGDVASVALVSDLKAFYGARLLSQVGCSFEQAEHPWPGLMVREYAGVPFSPVKHVLLQVFLTKCAPGSKALPYKLPGKKPRNAQALDAAAAAAIRLELRRVRARGLRTTMTALLQATGYWSAFRHDRRSFPLTSSELNLFRQTDLSERKSGGRDAHRKRMLRRLAVSRFTASPKPAGTP